VIVVITVVHHGLWLGQAMDPRAEQQAHEGCQDEIQVQQDQDGEKNNT
jgi:hypothetical protein